MRSPRRYWLRTLTVAESQASSPGTAPASCCVAQISHSEIMTRSSAGTAASGLAGNTPKLLQSRPVRLYAVLFAIGLVIYGVVAWDRVLHPSAAPHFVYQADAWLGGH